MPDESKLRREKFETKLPVPLTEEEAAAAKNEILRLMDEIEGHDRELALAKSNHKIATDRKQGTIDEKRKQLKLGIERDVEAEAIFNFETGKVSYVRQDTGEEYHVRDITAQEKQEKFKLKLS